MLFLIEKLVGSYKYYYRPHQELALKKHAKRNGLKISDIFYAALELYFKEHNIDKFDVEP